MKYIYIYYIICMVYGVDDEDDVLQVHKGLQKAALQMSTPVASWRLTSWHHWIYYIWFSVSGPVNYYNVSRYMYIYIYVYIYIYHIISYVSNINVYINIYYTDILIDDLYINDSQNHRY